MELTAPVDVPVVDAANSPDAVGPKRISLPSSSRPTGRRSLLARPDSGEVRIAVESPTTWPAPDAEIHRRTWRRRSPTLLLVADQPAVGVRQREGDEQQREDLAASSVKPFGFSNGWAELALYGPPPLVPSSLIASWLAIGPAGDRLVAPSTVVAVGEAVEVLHDALARRTRRRTRSPAAAARGALRGSGRPRSCRCVPPRRRDQSADRATTTARPTAADTKFCTVSPAICVRWLIVDSPA